jgi:hypothetical protein
MSSEFCRFHALVPHHFIIQNTLWGLFTLITTLNSPQFQTWTFVFPTVFFLWTACFFNFNSRPIITFTRRYNTRITGLTSPVSFAFLFRVPVLSYFSIIKNLFENILKLELTYDTLFATNLAILKMYWALIEGGEPSVINNSKQQPTCWNVDNTCSLKI